MPRLIVRPSDYLVITRELDLFCVLIWGIYASWGIASTVLGISTITTGLGEVFNFVWSASIGVISLIAAIAAASIFFKTPLSQVAKKKVELTASVTLLLLIAVYPLYLLLQGLDGDPNRLVTFVLSLLYVTIPLFRARNLWQRIKNYGVTRN